MLPLVTALFLLFVAVSALLFVPAPARADAPARLATQVTDPAGVLDSSVAPALRELSDKTGIQLFVVFVPSFDGTPAQEWTDETARLSGLGDRDALLAVATTDRAYAYSFPPDSRLSDGELTDVAAERIEPALSRGDWSGAVVAAAEGYTKAATGSGFSAAWALALLAAIIVVALVWVAARRRHRASSDPAAPAPGPSVADLSAQANALLIELDDDLRAAESELALATAQYGPDETARFRTALEESRQDVAEAFRLRMTLDDAQPSRATLEQIIARCRAADDRLDAESEAFDQLRDLEGRAGQAADEVERRRAAAEAGIPAAAVALQDLSHRWSGPPVSAVAGNIDAASERLRFATEAVGRARAALAGSSSTAGAGSSGAGAGASGAGASASGAGAGTSGAGAGTSGAGAGTSGGGSAAGGGGRAEAALAVRAAEQAVTQAEQLLGAIQRAASDLVAARAAADALVAEIEGEVVTARGLLGQAAGTPDTGLASAVEAAERALGVARAQLGQGLPDPVAVVAGLQAADATLDRALAAAQDAAARVTHARALLAQTLPVARAEVAAASDFIGTRRGAVNAGARTSLSEAQRHLALAESLAEQDPGTALSHAQQAQSLAGNAGRSASYDVQTWTGGGRGGGYGGYGTDSVAGAILGGLLFGDSSPGPARRRSSGGGMSWSGGGFGGSGARGRRTGGGGGGGGRSSGGGGRRGGGGRF